MSNITNVSWKVLRALADIAGMGGDLGKTLALRMADAALDVLEDAAAKTASTWDDSLLRALRDKLKVPEFDGSSPEQPMATLPGGGEIATAAPEAPTAPWDPNL